MNTPIINTTPVQGTDGLVTVTMNSHAATLLAELINQHHANTRREPLPNSGAPSFKGRESVNEGHGVIERN